MIDDAERLDEQLLVVRCQAGDEGAFAQLVERYQPRLRYYLRKMLFGVGEADDVLQEVWLDVFRSIARLKYPGAFRAWLYQVARARALKVFRKRRLSFQSLEENQIVDEERETETFGAEEIERIHAALDKLPAMQREVLVLRYIEDMSYDEIAAVVDCQVGTVRSRLHYAKSALGKELKKELHDER
jgi:RNA polymerase sigma-70 factor (ECF subfamily)